MHLHYDPIILPFVRSGLIMAVLGIYAANRPMVVARTFALLMLAVMLWTFCSVMELSSAMLAARMFRLKIKYVAAEPEPIIF